MNVPKNCEKILNSLRNYLLCWVTHRLEGLAIVAFGLWAAWPRNCDSNSCKGTNFLGLQNIQAVSEVLPASCSCGTWGAVVVARRQPVSLSSAKMNVWTHTAISPIWLHCMVHDSAQERLCTVNIIMLMNCPNSGCVSDSYNAQCAWFCHHRGANCLHFQVDVT